MRRLELAQVESEPLEFSERLELPAQAGGEDVVSLQEVSLSGSVNKAERGFVLTGTVQGRAVLCCSRCLKEFHFPFEEAVNVELLPLARAPQEEETRLVKRELDVWFLNEPVVDLEQLAAEQVALCLPMKPLCQEECLGLCPRCGADLNHLRCACPPSPDRRWASLMDWRPSK